MPSASTSRPMSASTPIVSSLCSRTLPTSLRPTERILPRTRVPSMASECRRWLDSWRQPLVFGALWATGLSAGTQGNREVCAGFEAVLSRLGKHSVDHRIDAGRQLRAQQAYRRMRFGSDLVHEARHGLGAERQLARQQLGETDA